MLSTLIKAIIQVSLSETLEYRIFYIHKRTNMYADIMLSNIVDVFMHFWTELRCVKRVTVRRNITVPCGTFKLNNFNFNYDIEANQINFFSAFSIRFCIPDEHYSVPPNVDLVTVISIHARYHKTFPPFVKTLKRPLISRHCVVFQRNDDLPYQQCIIEHEIDPKKNTQLWHSFFDVLQVWNL